MTGWPDTKPDLSPVIHGWLCADVRATLRRHLNAETRVVVELGSWLGQSARYILKQAPNAHLYCIDHWEGSVEHHRRPDTVGMLPTLYQQFIANLWEHKDRVTPLRMTTLTGMYQLHEHGVDPQLVYVDAAHDTESVLRDVSTAWALFPNATLVGDDFGWESVAEAVTTFVSETPEASRGFKAHGKAWEVVR